MVADANELDNLHWLKSMVSKELDLRPPSLVRIDRNSIIIHDESGMPIAHATVTNRWQGREINTFLVDPDHRGKGLSHKLLSKINEGRVFCYTRNSRLQSALKKAGYSRSLFPGIIATLTLAITRTGLLIWMIVTLDFKRIFHQIINLPKYKLYMKKD
tara:strand:- start:167 stop:640 length:474 start_codon:yes stop_codon:yes gene_type:complete